MSGIKEIIRYLRKEKGMTQEQLAAKAGISNVAISDWENGNKLPRMDSLLKLAKAFNMEVDQLLNYKLGDSIPEDIIISRIKIDNPEILKWLETEESIPYINFVYELSKQIPAALLGKLKFLIDPKTNAQEV